MLAPQQKVLRSLDARGQYPVYLLQRQQKNCRGEGAGFLWANSRKKISAVFPWHSSCSNQFSHKAWERGHQANTQTDMHTHTPVKSYATGKTLFVTALHWYKVNNKKIRRFIFTPHPLHFTLYLWLNLSTAYIILWQGTETVKCTLTTYLLCCSSKRTNPTCSAVLQYNPLYISCPWFQW